MMVNNSVFLLRVAAFVFGANDAQCPINPASTLDACTGKDLQMCHYTHDPSNNTCPDCGIWACDCWKGVYQCACETLGCDTNDQQHDMEEMSVGGMLSTQRRDSMDERIKEFQQFGQSSANATRGIISSLAVSVALASAIVVLDL
mmetsp:Transcript_13518/g.38024  ORF Transcript_13518/g.38024 Transcript_13518/m.38024 type:complete len:145 (-) Transcript_13518:1610-2044(-)